MSWVHDFFDDAYADAALVAPPEPAWVDALLARLALVPGMRVLDQCCGVGRLSRVLTERGLEVHGVDITPLYVERARALGGTYTCADAGAFVPEEPVHCVLNWWSSFGYAPSDEVNATLAARAREALLPGGTYALELTHGPHVLANHRAHFESEVGGLRVVRTSRLDRDTNLLHQTWILGSDPRPRRGVVRLYGPASLTALLHGVGFTKVQVAADLAGTPLTEAHPRMVVVAS